MRTTVPLLVMLFAATTAWAVDYIDAYGGPQSVNATVLTGSEGYLGSDGTTTWYVVSNDISYTHSISCYGNVNIILTDGKTMSVSNNGVGIRGEHNNILTIYGQTHGTGTLNTAMASFPTASSSSTAVQSPPRASTASIVTASSSTAAQ